MTLYVVVFFPQLFLLTPLLFLIPLCYFVCVNLVGDLHACMSLLFLISIHSSHANGSCSSTPAHSALHVALGQVTKSWTNYTCTGSEIWTMLTTQQFSPFFWADHWLFFSTPPPKPYWRHLKNNAFGKLIFHSPQLSLYSKGLPPPLPPLFTSYNPYFWLLLLPG